jgi:4-diphosphocytidyl-2-C-methyl-D-erythritol kinase
MQGIGEDLTPITTLPPCAIVLVNPKVAVPTGAVFDSLPSKQNPAMTDMPANMSFPEFTHWLTQQRNDLQPPAIKAAPAVQAALNALNKIPTVAFAGMSGSGATCFGITKNMADARHAARIIQVAEMSWWVTPAEILRA